MPENKIVDDYYNTQKTDKVSQDANSDKSKPQIKWKLKLKTKNNQKITL